MKKEYTGGYIGRKEKYEELQDMFSFLNFKIKYEFLNAKKNDLSEILKSRKFRFLNIGSPYKEQIIKYLDKMSESVKETRSCNLVVVKNNMLYGYNTDVINFARLVCENGIDVRNKNVLVLGNGSAARSAKKAFETMNSGNVILSGRKRKSEEDILYKEMYKTNPEILVNTTPTGNTSSKKLAYVSNYKNLEMVMDVSATPYRGLYLQEAKEKLKGNINGIDMLVSEVKMSLSHAFGILIPNFVCEDIKRKFIFKNVNVVLIGVKSENRIFISDDFEKNITEGYYDIKKIASKVTKQSKETFIKKNGEEAYRKLIEQISFALINMKGCIINTDDDTVENRGAMELLSRNGLLVYLKYLDFDDVYSKNKKKILVNKEVQEENYKKYNRLYEKYSDITITKKIKPEEIVREICDAISER